MRHRSRRWGLPAASVLLAAAVAAACAASTALGSPAAGPALTLVPATAKTCAPPQLVVGAGCLNPNGHGASDGWTFGATSAQQHYSTQWVTMYSWSVPASVPAAGTSVQLTAQGTELTKNPNASICADIGLSGGFGFKNQYVHVCAQSGKSASGSQSATIVPQGTGDATLTVGLQYGPSYTYQYTSGPPPAPQPKHKCTYGFRVPAVQGVPCNVTLRIVSGVPKGFAHPQVLVNTLVYFHAQVSGFEMGTEDVLVLRWRPAGSQGPFFQLESCFFVAKCTFPRPVFSKIPRGLEFDAAVVDRTNGELILQSEPPVDVAWTAEQQLRFDYTVPPRFGLDENHDGLIDYQTTADQIQPKEWPVDLTVASCPSPDTHTYTWKYVAPWGATGDLDAQLSSGCTWRAKFPGAGHPGGGEGVYRVTLTVASKPGQQQQTYKGQGLVTIQDWLILGLGDSLASGEGVPDQPGGANARWESQQCDRSELSYQAQVALMLEKDDPKTSVTFVHLACSGAAITDHGSAGNGGLLDSYTGIGPGPMLDPQVTAAKSLIGNREVDAILLSAGVNDFEFGNVVYECGRWDTFVNVKKAFSCFGQSYTDKTGRTFPTLAAFLQDRFAALPGEYMRLAEGLNKLATPDRVFITNYPDTLRGSDGQPCSIIDLTGPDHYVAIKKAVDINSLLTQFLNPLNLAIDATKDSNHWNVVPLTGTDFAHHGYCAANRWIVTRMQSFDDQGNQNGSLHPNKTGHEEIAGVVYPLVRAQLYPGGKARPPK